MSESSAPVSNRASLWALVGVLVAGLVTGCPRRTGHTWDDPELLSELWTAYTASYIRPQGYVVDPRRRGGAVTSEGQGYALLRAVWSGDEERFRRIFRWTEENLRRDDGLYAWLWAPEDGGRVLDRNTASDADQEIAFALVLAAQRFEDETYLNRARELLSAIRTVEAIHVARGWFPAAGDWAVGDRVVNLSYFLPYAYPYFEEVHPEGRWMEALSTGYRLIERSLTDLGAVLPPDFMTVGTDGSVRPVPPESGLSPHFSYDAVRIFWRVALDCRLHDRPRSCADPLRSRAAIRALFRDGTVHTRYSPSGEALSDEESLSFYGILLPTLRRHAPELARRVVEEKFDSAAIDAMLDEANRYYDMNWVWFGLAADRELILRRTPDPTAIDPSASSRFRWRRRYALLEPGQARKPVPGTGRESIVTPASAPAPGAAPGVREAGRSRRR